MKKLLLFLLTLAMIVSLAACGSGESQSAGSKAESGDSSAEGIQNNGKEESQESSAAPTTLRTPEEIYALLSNTVSVRLILSANFPGVLTMNTVVERTGEVYRVSANLSRQEGSTVSEMFLYRDGETYYQIVKDENGRWSKSETSAISPESLGISGLAPLFSSENYSQPDENGRYTMADAFVFDFQSIAFGNGSLEQADGAYTISMTGSMDGTQGTLQVIVDGVDSTQVTLPDVE